MIKFDKRDFLQKFGSLTILLVLMIIMGIASPHFFTFDNLMNVGVQASVNGVLAIGMLIVLIIGGIDLSNGAILALSGIFAAFLMRGGVAISIALLISSISGLFLGFFNGFIVTKMKLPPFIATLGTTGVFRGLALILTNGLPVSQLPAKLRVIGQDRLLGIPIPILITVLVAVIFYVILSHTVYGRYLFSIGSNYEATRLSGIKVSKYIIITYMVEGMLAAVAGIILLGRLAVAQPTAATGYESNAIAAAVIGGASFSGGSGSVLGAIVGALIMSILSNGFTLLGFNAFFQQLAIGFVVIFAVYLDIVQRGGERS
jgi:ribose transport system permease protein